MKYVITIIGPTAIGKTSLSIVLANYFKCDILSCDSRQFFKEMTIGTAVPNIAELNAAKHHFIQNKSIFENYTVGDFEKEAIAKLDELFLTNDYAILVGGSGLYVDAILKGFDEFPEISKHPAGYRHQLRCFYQRGWLRNQPRCRLPRQRPWPAQPGIGMRKDQCPPDPYFYRLCILRYSQRRCGVG